MADDLRADAASTTSAEETTDKPVEKAAKKAPAKKTTAKKAPAKKAAAKKAPAKKTAATTDEPASDAALDLGVEPAAAETAAPAKKTAAKKTAAKKTTAKKSTAKKAAEPVADQAEQGAQDDATAPAVLFQAPVVTTTTRRARKAPAPAEADGSADGSPAAGAAAPSEDAEQQPAAKKAAAKKSTSKSTAKKTTAKKASSTTSATSTDQPAAKATSDGAPAGDEPDDEVDDATETDDGSEQGGEGSGSSGRRRRRRGGRRRRKSGGSGGGDSADAQDSGDDAEDDDSDADGDSTDGNGSDGGSDGGSESSSSRRRRRRRRAGEDGGDAGDDPENTVTRVRSKRSVEDEITAVSGSTRLEAKKQRRREGREAGRRRAPIVSEAEFLARRESVDRVMVIRQREELTQIGVLEDRVLVEHYVARESQTSLIGNVYLGRVQNVLPSMEAAFIDIGKGRNAVLYAGEVNWSALGHKDGQPRKIENVLSSGQTVLVQVTKDPIGHKGARLTSQVSLAGRFLVYVPDGTTSGISRKLPDTERNRLKALLKEIVPDTAGVIVRTAAEGASEDELTRDVERLKARWEDIEAKARGNAPQLLYGEPDLTLKVVRDLFTEDFSKLVIQGDEAWETVQGYVAHVAPDLEERLERYDPGPDGQGGKADVFAEYRIDEQISKGLDRKVWLPSGGSLIIDRTEAMTVIDVNTGKFTGSGGNLEETVTKNNLEAAEEIVRQLRLRDIGGIIVVDFIDMVLESNRDLVLRRLVECLGRDRTRHQVAEVTSLGLVQMTRKRIGTGLVEAFSENCSHCQGRGIVIHEAPVEPKRSEEEPRRGSRRSGRGRGRGGDGDGGNGGGNGGGNKSDGGSKSDGGGKAKNGDGKGGDAASSAAPSPKDVAAMARAEQPEDGAPEEQKIEQAPVEEPKAEQAPVEEPKAEESPVEEPKAEESPVEEPKAEQSPVEEPKAEQAPVQEPAAPEPPKVVTRTRGRRATRPAGPPAGEAEAVVEAASTPPGRVGSVGAPPLDGVVEPGTATAEPGTALEPEDGADAPHVEHVPIKKKGSRKR